MPRALPALLILAAVAAADGKADFKAAQEQLEGAYYDRLEADKRDRLFEALGLWDHPNAVKSLADVVSRFGAYLGGIESKIGAANKELAPFADKPNLTLEEAHRRNSAVERLEALEGEWRRGNASMDILVGVLGRLEGDSTVRAALTLADKHPSWRMRWAVAGACPQWHAALQSSSASSRTFKVLEKLVQDGEPRVRLRVARSLGAFKRMEALPLLDKCLNDEDWRVRAAAVKSLEQTRSNEGVTLLIAAMKREKGRLKDDISDVLHRLSGENFTWADSWENWWRSVGQELPAKPRAGAAERAAKEREQKRDERNRFYGIPTRSDHVCYVIDVSGSMNKEVEQFDKRKIPVITGKKQLTPDDLPVEGRTRIEVARNELKRAIRNLPSKAYFSVVFFSHGVRVWRPEMTRATPDNKEAVIRELDTVTAAGATWTLGALRQAFTMAGAVAAPARTKREGEGIDTIFLLSDGGPTDNDMDEPQLMDPDKVLQAVHQWNQDAGIVIHTIAVDTEEVGTYFLERLAVQNGGVFVERRQ